MGRKLASVDNGKKAQYFYDQTGARVKKVVDGTVTEYHMAGDLIASETSNGKTMWYIYDCGANLLAVNIDGKYYIYIRNIQNNTIALVDKSGKIVVNYAYDSWGKLLSITSSLKDTIGIQNPFRYRGYYYDNETGMYYLKNRYYDPEIRRLLCLDRFFSTGHGSVEKNMISYCLNNPTTYFDPKGNLPCGCVYNGTGGDFARFEHGLPPGHCTHYKKSGKTTKVDITEHLDYEMAKNAKDLQKYKNKHGYIKSVVYFVDNVKTGGAWDFKNQKVWGLSADSLYYWHGNQMRFDDVGNFHFGYVGRVLFDMPDLMLGAGLAQLASDLKNYGKPKWSIFTNFDDPQD